MTPQVCSLHSRMGGWGLLAGERFGEVSPEFSFGHVEPVWLRRILVATLKAARCTKYGSQKNALRGNINVIVLNI